MKKNIKEEEEEIGRLKYHLLLSILFERPLEEKTQQAHTIIKNCTLSVLLEKKLFLQIFGKILRDEQKANASIQLSLLIITKMGISVKTKEIYKKCNIENFCI